MSHCHCHKLLTLDAWYRDKGCHSWVIYIYIHIYIIYFYSWSMLHLRHCRSQCTKCNEAWCRTKSNYAEILITAQILQIKQSHNPFPYLLSGNLYLVRRCLYWNESLPVYCLLACSCEVAGPGQVYLITLNNGWYLQTADAFISYSGGQSRYGLIQWETTLHCNVVSHWRSPYPEWSQIFCGKHTTIGINYEEYSGRDPPRTVYPMKYAHACVVLCFVVIVSSNLSRFLRSI